MGILASLLLLTICWFCPTQALAGRHIAALPTNGEHWPLVPAVTKGMAAPATVEIYEHDQTPREGRTPLLLIHGGGGEARPYFRMDGIASYLQTDKDFSQRFKLYYLRYNSRASLDETAKQAHDAILELSKSAKRPIYMMGYSLGGNVAQRALTDPEVDDAVDLVLSLGTPFHGSPLFCSDWFEYSLHKNLNYPWSRWVRTLSVRFYFKKNPHYLEELAWDNVDNNIPEVGEFRSKIKYGPRGNLTVDGASNTKLAAINNEGLLTKSKFVTYSGYMVNQYFLSSPTRQIVTALMTPWNFFTLKLPVFLGREHAALAVLNRDIARVVTDPNSSKFHTGPRPYILNDGLAPVSSCILLSAEAYQKFPLLRERDLDDVNEMLDVRLGRAFRNIDHITFADGAPPRKALRCKLVRDAMHPAEQPRSMFDWILTDIKQFEPKPMTARKHLKTLETPPAI